jgi:hypothetical protein
MRTIYSRAAPEAPQQILRKTALSRDAHLLSLSAPPTGHSRLLCLLNSLMKSAASPGDICNFGSGGGM